MPKRNREETPEFLKSEVPPRKRRCPPCPAEDTESPRQAAESKTAARASPELALWDILNRRIDGNSWFSATSVRNYILRDPIIDLMKSKSTVSGSSGSRLEKNLFMEQGNVFEDQIVNILKERYPDEIVTICDNLDTYFKLKRKESHSNKTVIEHMKKGVPILVQAPLFNNRNKTCGIADLIVRSDWLNKIFHVSPLSSEEVSVGCKFSTKQTFPYHYRVIDIKWSTLTLCADKTTIRNENLVKAYKAQLSIYNLALGEIQGYIPDTSYILCKGIKNSSTSDPFHQLAKVEFMRRDNFIISETADAIQWLHKLETQAPTLSYDPPSKSYLYPNMCNQYDHPYHKKKEEIAKKVGELTSIWMVGIENRQQAHDEGVLSWRDKKCNSDLLNIRNAHHSKVVDQIIRTNRDTKCLMQPRVIDDLRIKESHHKDFYIDFETIQPSLLNIDSKETTQFIFMIGVGCQTDNDFDFKVFDTNECKKDAETDLIRNFIDHIRGISDSPRIYHWGNIERSLLRSKIPSLPADYQKWFLDTTWVDLYDVFTSIPITIRGALKFGLKDIVEAMYQNGMIDLRFDTKINNGLSALFQGVEYMRTKNREILDEIEKYNELDCKALWKIVTYLRKN